MRLTELEEIELLGVNGGFWAGVIAVATIICPLVYNAAHDMREAYHEKNYYDSLYEELFPTPTPTPRPSSTSSSNTNGSSSVSPVPRPVPTPSL